MSSLLFASAGSAINAINAAAQHQGKGAMQSSAALCLSDSRNLYNRGDYANAKMLALKSLAYTVGIFSEVYQAADNG